MPTAPRVLRVFISSTFRDLQSEREELGKRVFPETRPRCEERGVVWGEVAADRTGASATPMQAWR